MATAIADGTVVRMAGEGLGIVDEGTVVLEDGRIVHAGPLARYDGDVDERIDASGAVVLPGLVDVHRHGSHALVRGAAQDLPEIEWMTDGLGPIVRHATDDDRIAGARLSVLEGLHSGVTTYGEYAGDVATLVEEAYRPAGVRTVATETISAVVDDREDRGPREPYAFDRERGRAALERAEDLFERFADADRVHPMYGPQAVDMVPPDVLEAVAERSREGGRDVHVHVAQGRRERLQVQARYGEDATAVGVLEDRGLLNERLLAAHCHGASAAERERLADAGARFVGCPSSIAAIDGVVPPLVGMAEHGAPVGLGTDQAPGPGGHDVLRELRTAAMLSKTERADPTAFPAWRALAVATRGGAAAVGLEGAIGTLEPGTRADVVVVDCETPGAAPTVSEPFHTAIPNLVYGRGRVRDVFVGGERVLRDGDVVGLDEDAVVEEAIERAERVFEAATDDWRSAGSELVTAVEDGYL